jgi:nucleoside-diphosphate-sugar epimerase
VGIVRTPRTDIGEAGVPYVPLLQAGQDLADVDCVVHSALDAKAGLRNFHRVNRELNSRVLDTALAGRCSLYVFLSSWVVYSCTQPTVAGYAESQPLAAGPRSDPYTRLKLESEQQVMEACAAAGVGWIILRPTIVMGPGMLWSDRIAGAVRWGLPAIRDRLVNAVHVDDLSTMTGRLIDNGVRDEIVNMGGCDLESDEYFETLGRFAQRRPLYLPGPLMRAARPLVPSTFWFLNDRRTVSLEKLERLAGPVPMRKPDELFGRWTGTRRPGTLDELKAIARSHHTFKAHGNNYSSWFMPSDPHCRISMGGYSGIVASEPGRVTVKAGTPLETVCDYLDARGEALGTLPEFLGISAGACFFVDVHGSSNHHFSLYELIEEIRYLDDNGDEITSRRDEALWSELRRRRSRFIVTEVTFRTEPAKLLSNTITWGGDKELDEYLAGRWRDNFATTIQWFPRRGRFFVYNIRVATPEEAAKARPAFTPFRGIPYNTQRLLLAVQRGVQVDRWHRILGPWRRLIYAPVVFGGWTNRGRQFWIDVEMLFTIEDGVAMVDKLRRLIAAGEIPYAKSTGIGMRFTHDPKRNRDYVWIEFFGKTEGIAKIVQLAEATAQRGIYFHGGKTVPPVTEGRLATDPMLI